MHLRIIWPSPTLHFIYFSFVFLHHSIPPYLYHGFVKLRVGDPVLPFADAFTICAPRMMFLSHMYLHDDIFVTKTITKTEAKQYLLITYENRYYDANALSLISFP